MNRKESKYFNTAIKMDEALITLLEKKDFAYITVKEICKEAGVNRSTFYLHYENIADLLQETTNYILEKHFAYYSVNLKDVSQQINQRCLDDMLFITEEYLVPYLTFIKENQRIFKVAIKQFRVMSFERVYSGMFKHIFDPILSRFRVPETERPFVIKFYLTGIFAVVMEWLDNDCKEDMAVIVKVITDCVMGERRIDGEPS